MSDGEVKRWWLRSKYDRNTTWYASTIKEYHEGYSSCVEVMTVEEHDRIVAELKARIEHSETKVTWLLHDNEKNVSERDAVIAKQAMVIERLREQRNWALNELGQYPEQAIANDDAEIAARER